MLHIEFHTAIGMAVRSQEKPAVAVYNHLIPESMTDRLILEHALDCTRALKWLQVDDICTGGVFLFPDEVQARDFYDIFNVKPIHGSGLIAVLFNSMGMEVAENR